jgi:hypothetical protein
MLGFVGPIESRGDLTRCEPWLLHHMMAPKQNKSLEKHTHKQTHTHTHTHTHFPKEPFPLFDLPHNPCGRVNPHGKIVDYSKP